MKTEQQINIYRFLVRVIQVEKNGQVDPQVLSLRRQEAEKSLSQKIRLSLYTLLIILVCLLYYPFYLIFSQLIKKKVAGKIKIENNHVTSRLPNK